MLIFCYKLKNKNFMLFEDKFEFRNDLKKLWATLP